VGWKLPVKKCFVGRWRNGHNRTTWSGRILANEVVKENGKKTISMTIQSWNEKKTPSFQLSLKTKKTEY
jgi:hypothetical protein